MENMKSLSIFLVLVAISLWSGNCRALHPNDAKLVDEICNKTPYPSHCIQFLQRDPRSSTTDVRGLAIIMVDVIEAKAKYTVNKINQLLKAGAREKEFLI